jgi:surface polysaccharide O-acyltransferase-like enzyme
LKAANNRILYLDVLRILAIFAVVILHTSSPTTYHYNHDPFSWFIGNFFNSMTRWCVPLFIMVSGALLLSTKQDESLGIFFKKRLNKVILPFICWIIIYFIYRHFHYGETITLFSAIRDVLDVNVYWHLWFMYMIIGLYLATPIFRVYIKSASRQNLFYFLALWFIASFIPVINTLYDVHIHYLFRTVSSYIGFFILGYYLSKYDLSHFKKRLLYLLAVLSLFITYFGTFYMTIQSNGDLDQTFYQYLRPNTILIAAAIFAAVKSAKIRPKHSRLIILLSNLSFGIYLVHPMLRNWIFEYINVQKETIITVPIDIVIISVLSFIIIYVLRKIPYVKRIVP